MAIVECDCGEVFVHTGRRLTARCEECGSRIDVGGPRSERDLDVSIDELADRWRNDPRHPRNGGPWSADRY